MLKEWQMTKTVLGLSNSIDSIHYCASNMNTIVSLLIDQIVHMMYAVRKIWWMTLMLVMLVKLN